MSYFFLDGYESMETYQPGEQPHDRPYIKLNANESSYPPSPAVLEALSTVEINSMSHYEDPYNLELRKTIGDIYGFPKEQIFVGNGADEVLSFIMMSFFREGFPIASTDITYDFYRTYATTFHLDYHKIPLKDDFSVDVDALVDCGCDVVLANPNNPTGRTMPMSDIERIVAKDPKRLVIVDEAYVDYGGETCLPLVDKYPNIIVVRTFSKSRNMAGGRIGFGISSKDIIDDMRNVKFWVSPFNMSKLSQAVGTAAIKDTAYYDDCIRQIIATRQYFQSELLEMGFQVIPTATNFAFFKATPQIPAELLTQKLKEHGILVRHYGFEPRIKDYVRVTIGTRAEMELVVRNMKAILEEYSAQETIRKVS